MSFANNLGALMAEKNLKPGGLASFCRVSESEVNAYLNGAEPDPASLQKICDRFHLKVKELAGDDDYESSTFGTELRKIRRAAGMSVRDVADAIGTNSSVIVRLEKDETKAPSDNIMEGLEILFGDDVTRIRKRYKKGTIKSFSRKAVIVKPHSPEEIEEGKRIGHRIYQLSRDNNIKAVDIADACGISITTWKRMINGCRPTDELAEKLADVIGCSVNDFYTDPVIVEETETESEVEMINGSFKKEWVDLIDLIENDTEYRAAVTALFRYAFEGKELEPIEGMPEASILLKLIRKGVK